MKNIIKKVMIYSMIGIMQVGFGATVIEASAWHNDASQRIVQLDDRHDNDNDRRREHDERMRRENERHEREMRRHEHESEREWHERQERENERHDRELRDIAALLVGIAIGSSNN
ncbi:flagellar biosynthesis GTPase FlhF [Sporomusaceae bacterium BoRhaA]|uniref:hypothetical protein n=1 Tax=Pelorhabdus rhamnosifermentans TaxID=2772457 RepID=UPI001C0648C9|nr:hypothetical protein [Pelorhabdus rhamnosifermentans]MBU2701277.1 flagellar biosynthesis GTPase FlhF [Pelorhabdus rhamnosifermentans]